MKPALGTSLLRLFTLQGSWNYERMMGVGMGVATEPLLRDLPGGPGGEAYRAALARHSRFFNSHPYLAGLAVGAGARAEYDGVPPEQIERLRTALCGPLGAVGDRVVWAGWLPFTSALAIAGVARGAGWAAVALFLLVYNIGHVALRWWALRSGWKLGMSVAQALRHPLLQRAAAVMGPAMAVAMGAALPLAAVYLGARFSGAWIAAFGGVTALAFILLRAFPSRLTGLRVGLIAVVIALLGGAAWR
ncbi:MAG TPA: PTS system mannose/fructose/sorbose family transporter subunit IID [Gemmatimonadales bacterium]|nr:PTS system mannose/fructose/sorbose family transporter subunit IID [Gemmatimonadales bacterium]